MLLLGPSGGGKSSLLLAIAGLHERSTGAEQEGVLRVEGEAGILFQDPEAQIVMGRAGDDVALGLEEHCVPTAEIGARVDAALRAVAFPYGPERRTDELSGGEKQRLALASVLALRPQVLLLDEPTADLDADGAAHLYAALERLSRETTVVLVEHRIADALRLVDRVIAIDGARGVIADGPPDTIFRSASRELERAGFWLPDARVARSRATHVGAPLVEARDASFRYPGARAAALAPTTVELREGEALAILGGNGAGKSTLLQLLGGLLAPSSGSVDASPLDRREPAPARWPARALPSRIGLAFQDPEHQFIARRAIDDVLVGTAGDAAARARAARFLERLRLAHLRDADPHTLSGGEKRRLGLAGILVAQPRALMLDEPTYGQDLATFREIVTLLDEERVKGTAIAFATHEPALVEAVADRTLLLERAA